MCIGDLGIIQFHYKPYNIIRKNKRQRKRIETHDKTLINIIVCFPCPRNFVHLYNLEYVWFWCYNLEAI